MKTSGGAGHPAGVDDPRAEAIADALDVLSDVSSWQLTSARWEQVDEVLQALDSAVAAGDLGAIQKATANLELLGPVRITRIGDVPTVAAPEPVRDATNHLVYSLTTMATDTDTDTDTATATATDTPQRRQAEGGGGDQPSSDRP